MLLTVDIGNTNIVFGCFSGPKLEAEFRLKTEAGRTIDEYAAILVTLISKKFADGYHFEGCVVSSVVPQVTSDIVKVLEDNFGVQPLVVGPGVKTGISIKTQDPAAVGSDRVVNALAGREFYGAPCLIVDFGTATSFDYVSRAGDYEGGVIAPGLNLSLESLVRNTAKLPRIELVMPKTVVGKSTVGAMQSGAVLGYVCMVDGLISKIIEEVGPIEHVIATGGLGSLLCQHSKLIKHYDPYLTLKGMTIVARLNS